MGSAVPQLFRICARMVSAEQAGDGSYGSYIICEVVARFNGWAICGCTERQGLATPLSSQLAWGIALAEPPLCGVYTAKR